MYGVCAILSGEHSSPLCDYCGVRDVGGQAWKPAPTSVYFPQTHDSVFGNKSFNQFFSKNCGGLEAVPPRMRVQSLLNGYALSQISRFVYVAAA